MNYHDQTPALVTQRPCGRPMTHSRSAGVVAPASQGGSEGERTMAFLYRSPDNGDTGQDRRQCARCTRGHGPVDRSSAALPASNRRKGIEQLRAWLVEHPEWQQAGDIRSLYHDPFTLPWNKWSETQMPVKPGAAVKRRAHARRWGAPMGTADQGRPRD